MKTCLVIGAVCGVLGALTGAPLIASVLVGMAFGLFTVYSR
jgi:hypothetical protein